MQIYIQILTRIVILDNNDSFTYNLVELLRHLGIKNPKVLPHSWSNQIPNADAYILSPGAGLPKEKELMQQFLNTKLNQKPILGICLGHQAIAEYIGMKLTNLPNPNHGYCASINYSNNNLLFKGIKDELKVGLYHSWGITVDEIKNSPLKIIADYNNFVMAFQHKYLPIYGLQFHPESFLTEKGHVIMNNWLNSILQSNDKFQKKSH